MTSNEFLSTSLISPEVIVFCLAAAGLLCVFLRQLKKKIDASTFTVTPETLGEQSEHITAILKTLKVPKTGINSALLLLEETVMRIQENAYQTVTVVVRKHLGDVFLDLSATGEAYNPYEKVTSLAEESLESYREMIFQANRSRLSYERRGKQNCMTILAYSAGSRSMYYTVAGMILGIVSGCLLRFLPHEALTLYVEPIMNAVQSLVMNALSMLMAPVLFLSLCSSFSSLSSGSELSRMSGKVLGTFLFTTIATIIIAYIISLFFFSVDLPLLPETMLNTPIEGVEVEEFSFFDMLLDIIPSNLITPVSEGNMLQIIFIAVFSGVALSALQNKVTHIRTFVNEANEVFLKMISMVILFMPLVSFCSMTRLFVNSDLHAILSVILFLLALLTGVASIFIFNLILIVTVGKISPAPYLRKIFKFLITPFILDSSSACIPITMEFTRNKLGVSNKVSAFTIPLGATINMSGTAMSLTLLLMLLSKLSGVTFSPAELVRLAMYIIVFSVGVAGVPGVGFIVIVMLLTVAKVPVGSVGLVLGIFTIIDRLTTVTNVHGDVATALMVSCSEKDLNKEIYNS